MSIQDILNQLELSYGRPTGHELLLNDALFRLPFRNTEAPKHLFWHIEQCQEIQLIANNPYTPMQLMTNAVQLLMSSGIFPPREFEDWEATANKMYASLKVFVHGAYVLKRYAQAEGVSNMPEQREYWPEIWSRFGAGVRSFL